MIVKKVGSYSIQKDGTSYYRVLKGRKRIESFLLLAAAEKYMAQRLEAETDASINR